MEGSFEKIDSTIMPIEKNFQEFFWLFKNIEKNLNKKITKIPKLIFRASIDGFKAENFHEKCDNKKPILILIKSEFNKKFGGFVNESFFSPIEGEPKSCQQTFLYSVDNKFISPIKDKDFAIRCNKDWGPVFGGNNGCDLAISSNCNSNTKSHTNNFGNSYTLPKSISYLTPKSRAFLSTNNPIGYFKVEDYEAWEFIE